MFSFLLYGWVNRIVCITAAVVACHIFFVSIGRSSDSDQVTNLDRDLEILIEKHTVRNLLPVIENEAAPEGPLFELGKELFFSKSLSGGYDVACASCHHPHLAGGDKLSLPVGESAYQPDLLGPGRWHNWKKSQDPKSRGGPNVPRHSQTIFNSALYSSAMFYDGRVFRLPNNATNTNSGAPAFRTPESNLWQADPQAGKSLLSAQARFPVVSAHEMLGFGIGEGSDHNAVRKLLVGRLKNQSATAANNDWLKLFRKAFNAPYKSADELITFQNIQEAIAFYERSQIFIDNDWYAYVRGDKTRLSQKRKRERCYFLKRFQMEAPGAQGVTHHPRSQTRPFTILLSHNLAAVFRPIKMTMAGDVLHRTTRIDTVSARLRY